MTQLPTKAVILARGLGTRLRVASAESQLSPEQERIAQTGVKALMPIGDGRVLLDLIVEGLGNAHFSQICLVIGPEHEIIRDHCAKCGLDVDLAIQSEPRGTADAVLAAENFVLEGEIFAVVNSDNLYPSECLEKLRENGRPGLLAFERSSLVTKSNIPEERIAKFATIEIDAEGFLRKITEKPGFVPESGYVSMNAWMFDTQIFDACRAINPTERGELELTSAVQYAIDALGQRFSAIRVEEGVLDLSSRADVHSFSKFLGGRTG